MTRKLSIQEQETHIYYDVENKCWIADTTYLPHMRKFMQKGWKKTSETLYDDGTPEGMSFITEGRKGISITNPNGSRQMTDEQREAARKRLQKYHAEKGNIDFDEEDLSSVSEEDEDDYEDDEDDNFIEMTSI